MKMPPEDSEGFLYLRYSTSNQDQRSLDGQELICRRFAVAHNIKVARVFSDSERSGASTYGRTGLFDMLKFIEQEKPAFVLVEDLDRLSRNPADMHMLANMLEEEDVILITVAHGVVDDFQLGMKAIQSKQVLRDASFKTRRGQELVVEQGRISGSITYGHIKVHKIDERGKPINGLRAIDPAPGGPASIVPWIFEEYVAGRSTLEICRDLNARGVPSPRGGKWGPGVLTGSKGASVGILRNRLYIGEFVWGRTKRKKKKGKVKTEPTSSADRKISFHPDLVLVPRELFEAAQDLLAERGQGRFHEWRRTDYLFSRKIHCGVCGSRMAVVNGRLGCMGRNRKGICDNSRRVPREELEEACIAKLKEALLQDGVIDHSLKAYRDEAKRLQAEYETRNSGGSARLAEVERKLEKATNKYLDNTDGYLGDVLKRQIEELEAERLRLKRELSRTPPMAATLLASEVIIPQIQATIEDLRNALQGEDREAARARGMLRELFSRIEVKPAPGTEADGRGAGPVLVTVEGPINALMELGDIRIDRDTQYGSRPKTVLDDPISYFFAFRLECADARLAQVRQDLPILARALDDADVPVPKQTFLRLLAGGQPFFTEKMAEELEDRLRRALTHLKENGLARPIMAGPKRTGWVWNDIPMTDKEWKARALRAPVDGYRLPILLASPPEASVVVIGAPGSGTAG